MTFSEKEKEILEFWERERVFERSVSERPADKPYVFYDGPPFATGLPHYGHLPSQFLKDAVPRYWTMKGFRVNRVWGWDCHGLPIENIIEEKLQLKSKKDIELYGIGKFNEQCRDTVLTYAHEWKKSIGRIGRWVDMDNAYKTMDTNFMESVWWVFSEIWKKGLIYEGKKAMHVCPRCSTPLSNFEVTQGYKEVTDLSVTAQFKLTNAQEKLGLPGAVSLLAWTTTPWTLPGNVLLAVGPQIKYILLQHKQSGDQVIIALDRWAAYSEKISKDEYVQVDGAFKGSDLIGLTYEPLFPYFKNTANAFRVVAADFVTTEDGTGVVHIAPAFGEDDYQVGSREDVGFVQHVGMDGRFVDEVIDFAQQDVKPKENPAKTDIEIIKWLAHNGKLFFKEKYTHSYPHCWRCDTPLLNYATTSWFVSVTKIKEALISANQKTAWVPEHMRDGRFGHWLENARDWAISRDRFWGAPLPVWKNEKGDVAVIGSREELEQLSGKKIDDLHKHIIDDITFEKDGLIYTRVPQVLDCWFESGSMPYGQMHYPFENKEAFEAGFPAQFIAEGQDQTRGWFYTLHVLATALTGGEHPSIPAVQATSAFRHVVVNGIVLAQDGKKMSKRLKNYPDLMTVIEAYGADAVRYYILSSAVVQAENLNFSEEGVRELYNKYINTLWNVLLFYQQSRSSIPNELAEPSNKRTVLDRWILSRLARLHASVTDNMDAYRIADATRPILDFISDLSQWYVRRSRERLKGEDVADREACLRVLETVLKKLSLLIAPFTPFSAEMIHAGLPPSERKEVSVHLEMWPESATGDIDPELEDQMDGARLIVEMGHSLRAEAKIKVRQPLATLFVSAPLSDEIASLIADEVNVKKVTHAPIPADCSSKENRGVRVGLDVALTPELKQEGLLRELVRQINAQRKAEGLTARDRIDLVYQTVDPELDRVMTLYADSLKKSVVAQTVEKRTIEKMTILTVDGRELSVSLSVTA